MRGYLDQGDLTQVNYVRFCHDVDHPEDIAPVYRPKKPEPEALVLHGQQRDAGSSFFEGPTLGLDVVSNRFSEQPVNKANDPRSVQERVRALVVMHRLRIEEYFRDFDKLRKGRVTRTQFESVLSALKVSLSKQELDALFAQFATEEGFFDHAAFCASINAAFTDPSLQKNPLSSVAPVTVKSTQCARKNYLATSPEEAALLERLLAEYRRAVQIKGLYLKPMFQNFDRTRSQHVSKQQFLRVLSTLGVFAEQPQLNALLKAYLDKGNAEEVNYADFCEDVDSSDQLFGVSRAYNHSFDYYPKNRPRPTGVDIRRDLPNDVEDILAKLRSFSQQQRIRIDEFFRDFDKLKKGSISQAQFRIGLNMSKIVLSSAEFAALCAHFRDPADPARIRYRDFCDQIDLVFTKKNLERSVDIVLNDARTESFYGKAAPSQEQERLVEDVKQRFSDLARRLRLDAKSFF